MKSVTNVQGEGQGRWAEAAGGEPAEVETHIQPGRATWEFGCCSNRDGKP